MGVFIAAELQSGEKRRIAHIKRGGASEQGHYKTAKGPQVHGEAVGLSGNHLTAQKKQSVMAP